MVSKDVLPHSLHLHTNRSFNCFAFQFDSTIYMSIGVSHAMHIPHSTHFASALGDLDLFTFSLSFPYLYSSLIYYIIFFSLFPLEEKNIYF